MSDSTDLERRATALLERGSYAELVALVRGEMPGVFLSPSAHAFLSAGYAGVGDEAGARREQMVAEEALAGILGSGDGTVERPWRVRRVSDEYDVLRSQGRRSHDQRFVTLGDRALDHHQCDDGTEAWFDVTLLGIRSA